MRKEYLYIIMCICQAIVCRAQTSLPDTLEQARDFTYTLASSRQGTLYAIRSEWLLLYFYDPTCEDCHALMNRLNDSEIIRGLIATKRMQVLAVYPEEDTVAWSEHAAHVPPAWINGYDRGAKIHTEGLYAIRSLPSLYLLDRDKKIRLKNATVEDVEKEAGLIAIPHETEK